MQAMLPNGQSMPVAYGLLPDKKTQTYTKFLGILAKATPDMFAGTVFPYINCCFSNAYTYL